ncbi:abortive phage infection protein [Halobiforma lacisalsi AJ5]|uniref:Abortive infection protein n=1 Tax=Natronobacterium lacisalsi AJ5 TaxID=358396 RepID=M0L1K2_NATLA|nr:CPBP family glutamic-type intramembrane protease [Halobiforma lacisalsi]APW96293.1 abortive phage infection protein [Halobiforma lacisalsi AJ5]EMA27437.1 abortive infection protein [Halobiforma lacisalsi AJ5]
MADWTTFAGITGVVLVLLLVLSHLTQSTFSESDGDDPSEEPTDSPTSVDLESESIGVPRDSGSSRNGRRDDERRGRRPDSGSVPGPDPGFDSDSESSVEPTDSSPEPEDPDLRPGRESPASDASDPRDRHARGESGESGRPTTDTPGSEPRTRTRPPERRGRPRMREGSEQGEIDPESLSTGALLANVALSQGLFLFVLIGAVVYTGIPLEALGIDLSVAYLETGLVVGLLAGLPLYVGNEIAAAAATRFGFDHDERLRELLAPETLQGWFVLLVGVLPVIAVFEELLFRAALIGALSTGFGIDPWLLAVLSSIAFGVGHGMQGSVGVVVTGLLGFVLAAIFVVTGSFLVVVIAHYLINALEFFVHEGLGLEWAGAVVE